MPTWSELFKHSFVSHFQLVLGWLFGIASPVAIEGLKRRKRLKELRKAMAHELHELQFSMAMKAYIFKNKVGQLDDEFLLFFEQLAQKYKGQEDAGPILKLLPAVRHMSVEERAEKSSGTGLWLSEGAAPLLGIHTNEIALFPLAEQAFLLNVSKHLRILNDHIGLARRNYERTFDDLSAVNRKALETNILGSYVALADRSLWIAKLIDGAPASLRVV